MTDQKPDQEQTEDPYQNTPDADLGTNPSEAFDINSVIADARKIITDPVGFYRDMPQTGGYTNPLLFVVVMGLATGVIGFVLSLIGLAKFNTMIGGAVGFGMLIFMPIALVIGSFIGGAILWVVWKLMGSQKSYETAVRCVAYSSAITPIVSALSIIPYIAGIVKTLWSCFLMYTASVQTHELKEQTAKIVFGIFAAIGLISGIGSEHTVRKYGNAAEQWKAQLEKRHEDGTIGKSLQELENFEDMTPEEAGKQLGKFLSGMEEFSKGLEESVEDAQKDQKSN
ncbi:YIP1 family protein [Arenicella xantha]|uniref:Yip1 domain-containing protein n=1 Tax=Arenicella xantha TaxID=644221 RepID=A0A395JSH2_9GAMM|nr:Yip1 family protein [Arenicella xantha]RBP53485.1 hypothetical protein DFR28_101871 [Arenicella xantha]